MQIIENKGLLLRLKNPEKVTEAIPKSKLLEDGSLLVKWGLEEAQVLKNLRIKNVPSPIEAHYEWPGLYKPFAHQKKTAAFLTLHRKAFCFNEQGTGKTSSVIWAADYLMSIGQIKRVLVICPLSIMQSAWQNDLFKFAMHRTSAVAHSYTREKRVQTIQSDAEFVIINFDGVEIVLDALLAADFDLIVVDECNGLKNPTTKRWKAINSLVKPKTWLWMLTGTPAAQSPVDAYGLAKMVNPSGVPKFLGGFKDMVMQKITQFKWIPRPRAEQIVHQVLQPAIRFTKQECLDLPDITHTTREVPITAQQRKYYKLIKQQMMAVAAGEEITAVNAAATINKLLQLSCGAVYSDTGEIVAFDAKNRIEALKEVIEEASHKVLVFVAYTHAIHIIKEELTAAGISNEVINGKVPPARRTDIFNKFQSEHDPQVLIIQPQAAAHGVTLTAANVVVWWGPITSCEVYMQANARVHRSGQRNPCTVVHLQGSEVENKIYTMLQNNIDVHSRVVDLYKNVGTLVDNVK
jgi:SNF2 family DNA or RNA helicase